MRPQIILRYLGLILLFNAFFLLISTLVSAATGGGAFFSLLFSTVVSVLFGLFPLVFVPPSDDITNREGLYIVVCCWLLSCLAGALPFVLWGGEFTFTNAWFESVSGYTTTGASILTSVEALPPGLLFWRAATHWMGGVGIIIFVLAILPAMGGAYLVLYRNEMSTLAQESLQYRTRKTLKILLYVYIGLTFMETLLLIAEGMGPLDAVAHAFATIATGGFSTKNTSIAYYSSPVIEITVIAFMFLSAVNFGLLFQCVTGHPGDLLKSPVFRYYTASLVIGVILVAVNLHGSIYPGWIDAWRHAAFQVIAQGTSTGFASADSAVWPPFAQLVIIFLMIQGGCAGSTSGGMKADRLILFWKVVRRRMVKLRHPKAVVVIRAGQSVVDDDVAETVLTFILLYLLVLFVSTLAITLFGVDLLTAFSGTTAAMGGVGPGFGTVGSMANYGHMPGAVKWILTLDMLVGRLEIFGLILFFTITRWK
ncbi:MAG: TrkH family potassium uptake protein [Thermodesulfobacteriota bacterium]